MATAIYAAAIRTIAAHSPITPLIRELADTDLLAALDLRRSSPFMVADRIADGTLVLLAPGVQVLPIDASTNLTQVVVLDGPNHGLTGWILTPRLVG